MDDMIKYIFDSMKVTAYDIRDLRRLIKSHSGAIGRLSLATLAITAYIAVHEKHHKQEKEELMCKLDSQNAAIERMNLKILSLNEKLKGEAKM